jgi:hypothetical protein
MDAQPLPDQTQQRLQRLQQRMQDIMRTTLEVRGLDPQKYAVDVENGRIVPIQSEQDFEEESA